jgi:hypothetical protein
MPTETPGAAVAHSTILSEVHMVVSRELPPTRTRGLKGMEPKPDPDSVKLPLPDLGRLEVETRLGLAVL